MRFNLLLYVPTVATDLDIEYGVFVQHHLMDDADIGLDYFEFKKINPENYALDIVDEKEVTKKLRKDCLVDGFTLNSYYSIDVGSSYNRNINKEEVRQVFICFKNNSKEPIDAFVRVNDEQNSKDYQVYNNLIFFTLWASPDMQGISELPLSVGKVNYSDFEYFRGTVKQEVNNQWRSVLTNKRNSSKAALAENAKEVSQLQNTEELAPPQLQTMVPTENDATVQISEPTTELRIEAPQPILIPQNDNVVINDKEGSDAFKVIAYILLALGVLSILGKLFGGS